MMTRLHNSRRLYEPSDADLRDAWARWESPDIIHSFLMDWIDMTAYDKVAMFYGLVLPQMLGRQVANRITLQRVLDLDLASRYPSAVPDGC
jgi:hypothetical protein